MADEQPGHINRDVRDVTSVPLAKDLVKDNVGSTVRNNSNFKAVTEAEAAAASALYLDPAIQARQPSPVGSHEAGAPHTVATRDFENNKKEGMKPAGSGAEENKVYRGPVVIMSDAENYIGVRDPPRRKCESCCVC